MVIGAGRYHSSLAGLLDNISFVVLYPWLTLASLLISCYLSTPWEVQHPQSKLTHYFVYGPALALLTIAFAPLGLCGYLLHIVVSHVFKCDKFIIMNIVHKPNVSQNGHCKHEYDTFGDRLLHPSKFTFCSSNLLLAPECIVRFNNSKFVYTRAPKVARRLLWQSNHHGENGTFSKRAEHISTLFPDVDFFCLQEVWERVWALFLIKELQQKYSHFVYDVGENKLNVNGCIGGSGLFFASKYPILGAEFETFKCRKGWARCVSYGVLCIKVDVGSPGERRVGFVANLHTQAYQDRERIIFEEMTQAHEVFEKFCRDSLEPDETAVFQVMCGDFNFDNMSPGDEPTQNHPLFDDYEDFCRLGPGADKPWTIGTEMRQMMMFDERLHNPNKFWGILVNDIERRRFVLDADVKSQTLELARALPPVDVQGRLKATQSGGRRRIDLVLHRRSPAVRVVDYTFVAALAGLTDHIPVCMTIATD